MAQNYTRQSTLSDGDTITASLFNDEYNQLVNAFTYSSTSASSTGHRHDGSAGQGGNIFKIGDIDFLNKIEVDSTNNRLGFYVEVSSAAVEQIRIQDGSVVPVTTNDIDLGTSSLQFKDLYIDGTANVDSLTLTSGSTVTTILDEDDLSSDSATALVTQQSVKAYVDAQVTAQDFDFQADSGGALSIDLDSETMTFTGGTGITTTGLANDVTFAIDSTVTTLTGTQTLTNKTLTSPDVNTPDIDGGTIDGTVIGGTTAAAGSFTAVSATGNITVDGTVDGRDVATDGTKLDGIEAGATADQTAAEIRTLVDSATDSNVFTDADHTKLDGIEELADVTDTANVTAAGALMDSEVTNLAQVKAFDSADYATAAQGSTADSALQNVVEDTTPQLGGDLDTNGNDVTFGDNDKAIFGAGSDLQIYHTATGNHSIIEEVGGGNLVVRTNGPHIEFDKGSTEYMARMLVDGAVELYYDSALKLATTSTGIDVTGTLTASSGASTFNSDSSANTVNFDGRSSDNIAQLNFRPNGGASNYSQIQSRSTELFVKTIANIPMSFHTNNTERLGIANNGDISFYNSAGTSQDLFWDASTSRLGLGTTSPSYVVHASTADNTIAQFQSTDNRGAILISDDDTNSYFGSEGGSTYISNAGGALSSGQLVIDSSGNVGIGGSFAGEKLEVYGNIRTRGASTEDQFIEIGHGRTGNGYSFLDLVGDATYTDYGLRIIRNNGGANTTSVIQHRGTGDFQLRTDESAAIAFSTDGSERMRIDSSGNVGIGRAPTAIGAFKIIEAYNNATSGGFFNAINNTGEFRFVKESVHGYFNMTDSGSTIFQSNGSERMRIDNSGHLIAPNGITLGTAVGTYAAANTLDDYEEGTFTPTIGGGTSNPTSVTYDGARYGSYIKVGKKVTVQIRMRTDAVSGGSGLLKIQGLPFTSASSIYGAVSVGYTASWSGEPPVGGYVNTGGDFAYLTYKTSVNGALAEYVQISDLNTGGNSNDLIMTITYETA